MIFSACQTDWPPETVTRLFWLALAGNDVNAARQYATRATRDLVGNEPLSAWKIETLETGEVRVISGRQAVVAAEVEYDRNGAVRTLRFNTYLLREQDAWKVDYRKTLDNLASGPFDELMQDLQNFGENFGKQLQKQLPRIEKGIQSFGEQLQEQLNKQFEEFERELEKALPPSEKRPKSQEPNAI
ncbi:MAG: hypothetical protein ACU837_10775 [Gammaproteobacteria bacterium]